MVTDTHLAIRQERRLLKNSSNLANKEGKMAQYSYIGDMAYIVRLFKGDIRPVEVVGDKPSQIEYEIFCVVRMIDYDDDRLQFEKATRHARAAFEAHYRNR